MEDEFVQFMVTVPVVAVIVTAFAAPNIIGDADVNVPVTPAVLKLKEPPAVIPVPAVLLSVNTVKLTSTFTVNVLLYTSSAAVGTVPVFHVAPVFQFPFATARTSAIMNYYTVK